MPFSLASFLRVGGLETLDLPFGVVVAERRVVVERDLRVQRDDPAVGGLDERVDLASVASSARSAAKSFTRRSAAWSRASSGSRAG
jgi:hypothetical protein